MLAEVLSVMKDAVNDYLSTLSGWNGSDTDQGRVVFIDSEELDNLDFKMGTISIVLVNVEQEHAVRPADPRRRALSDGTTSQVQPPIHLNLYVLFVARFKEYASSLKYLSHILQFFVTRPLLDHDNTPALHKGIEQLTLELLTLPFSELNHLWGVLRTAYQPSLLYKVRMVVFEDEEGLAAPPVVEPVLRILR